MFEIPMKHRGKRIKALREKAGLESEAVAEITGINNSWYWDLKAYDDEVTDTLTLKQVTKLAEILSVTPRQLLSEEADTDIAGEVIPSELANRIKHFLESKKMGMKEFEDIVGWELALFLDEPEKVLEQPPNQNRALFNHFVEKNNLFFYAKNGL